MRHLPAVKPFPALVGTPKESSAVYDLWQRSIADLGPPPELLIKPKSISAPAPLPEEVKPHATEHVAFQVLDNPILQGKVTICVLGYGNYHQLIERCLTSIIDSVPPHRYDLRVALNQPCDASLKFVKEVAPTAIYRDHGQRRKYNAMAAMFHDPAHPITTPYTIWFDDDTAVVQRNWLPVLAETIIANHPHGVRLFGKKMYHDLKMYHKNGHNPKTWFEQATWWKGAQLRLKGKEQYGPNGSCIDFVAGWFWAIETAAIYACQIPDVRLEHNGGDCCIGAQIHQGGYRIKDFNADKKFIWTPTKEAGGRRGHSQAFRWADPATIANHKSGQ